MLATDTHTLIEELKSTIVRLERENRQLRRMATIDPLTLVANRRTFDNQLFEEWKRVRRNSSVLSLLLLDIDQFQEISNCYGHKIANSILQRVAFVLCRVPRRSTDLFARYGESEFAVILPDTPEEGAKRLAERLLKQAHFCEVTISIGIASITAFERDFGQFTSIAGQALYQSKKRDGNCFVVG
jgi:diguanylate cyclase (GGDEF)-like protein